MLKSKKIVMLIVVMLIIGLLGVMSCTVKATSDNPIDISGSLGGDTQQAEANQITANQIAANAQAANSQVIQPTTNTSTNTNGNGNTLPKTGVTEDITVMFFIIVCLISAVYAYKKIRDYKV